MRFGLLLPHFGAGTSHERLFGLATRLEGYGFHSAWVRDHLGFSGGLAFERAGTHFVDPLVTMTAVAATSGLTVGTATLTPFRQPVVLAQTIGSLSYLARGRITLGVGLGKTRAMELVGRTGKDRVAMFEDMVGVLRATAKPGASYHGHFTSFDDLTLDPGPPADLPLWYCGVSEAALNRAVAHTDGWMPGRCPFPVFDRYRAGLDARAEAAGKRMRIGLVPLVSLGCDRASALVGINVEGLLASLRAKPALLPDGPFESPDELRGAVLAGNAADLREDLHAIADRGVDEVVLDLRERMDAFDETLQCLAEDVLPAFTPPTREEGR